MVERPTQEWELSNDKVSRIAPDLAFRSRVMAIQGEREHMKREKLPQSLKRQSDVFMEAQLQRCLDRYNGSSAKEQVRIYFEWAQKFAEGYLLSRNHRAEDIESAEVHKAAEIARDYIGEGNHDFFATCVDGRNMPTVMFSKVPHVGGVLRAPAGTVSGFMDSHRKDSVFIDHESPVVKQIERILVQRPGETIFYGLDSHLGCAARGLIHATEGGWEQDSGLRSDVKAKMMTANGLVQLRNQLRREGKNVAEIIPTFFSYDSGSGFVVMGLEANVDSDDVRTEGFSAATLNELATKGRIVRAHDLIHDPEVVEELMSVLSPASADFRHDFKGSLLSNWEALIQLYDEGKGVTFSKILTALTTAYQSSGWSVGEVDSITQNEISKRTIYQKAKFLLKNLLTRFSIAGTSVDDPNRDAHSHEPSVWPFNTHQEDLAVITDGGYGPFESLDAFSVFSKDLQKMLPNTQLTIDLIRGSRRSKNITNPIKDVKFSSLDQFVSAPVLVTNKAILRISDESTWKELELFDMGALFAGIDWDDPEIYEWDENDLLTVMRDLAGESKLKIGWDEGTALVKTIFELFNRQRIMLKDKAFRHMIFRGNIIVMNTIVDANRRPRLILPLAI